MVLTTNVTPRGQFWRAHNLLEYGTDIGITSKVSWTRENRVGRDLEVIGSGVIIFPHDVAGFRFCSSASCENSILGCGI